MADPPLLLYDFPGSICCQMTRLALAEKGLPYRRRTVDIMDRAEQFEPWYVALNPRAVVPTLAIGEEIVTDTMRIVRRVDRDFGGPALTPADPAEAAEMEAIMADAMGLHYGVLLYANRRGADGTAPTVVARGRMLRDLLARRPDLEETLSRRIAGNERLQRILADPGEVARHVGAARALVGRLDAALADRPFAAAARYSLADAFASGALARFRIHGFAPWWEDGGAPNVAGYYERMKARPSWAEAGVIDRGTERDL